MKFSKQDLAHSRNMLKALGKGKWELDGMEILAHAQMMNWFASFQKKVEEDAVLQDAMAAAEAKKAEDATKKPLEPKNPVLDIAKPAPDSTKVSKPKAKKE
jgi:hypothetical protein